MNRPCESCQHDHGDLYICDSYSAELRAEIEEANRRWRANLSHPAWVAEQVRKDPRMADAISIWRIFAGLDEKPLP